MEIKLTYAYITVVMGTMYTEGIYLCRPMRLHRCVCAGMRVIMCVYGWMYVCIMHVYILCVHACLYLLR